MKRALWSSRLAYILTVAGATIGFGATWRFPYLVGENGGGAYVLTFVISMLLLGVPIILVENVIGRRSHANIIDAFKLSLKKHKSSTIRFWELFGYTAILGAFGIISYYMVIGGWVIAYIISILKGFVGLGGIDLSAPISKDQTSLIYTDTILDSPWTITICTIIFVLMNYFILRKGIIKGIENSVKRLMPLLFICLAIMVIRSVTLDNALDGIKFYLTPDFSKISPKLFLDVLGQVFFALSLGFGVMVTLSSYLPNKEPLVKTAVISAVLNTVIALGCGFMIFPTLSSAGLSPDSGPSLVFMTLPVAFSKIPFGNLFALVFFLLLIVAALTTSLTIYQVIITALTEKFKMKLNKAINYTLGVIFVLGNIPCILGSSVLNDFHIAGKNLFDLYDFISGNILFVITALGTTLFCGWVLKYEAHREIDNNIEDKKSLVGKCWYDYIKYIAPFIILSIFVYGII